MGEYVGELQEALHLEEWDITLDWETQLPEHTTLQATRAPHSRHMRISFGPAFSRRPLGIRRDLLTTELLACHTTGLASVVEGILAGDSEYVARNAISQAIETCSGEVAPHLPLPPEKERHLREVPQVP